MHIHSIHLKNFRNYQEQVLELQPGKTILIGENAQGKSNLLEAIEVASLGKSSRTGNDQDLIAWQQAKMIIEVAYEKGGFAETVGVSLAKPTAGKGARLERKIHVNGVAQNSVRGLLGRLVCVSFTTEDLNLLRGGPSYRRNWIDDIICRIRPIYHEDLSAYQKVVTQRNKLLKTLFEKGKITVTDQDELLAWDKQLARFGAKIIKERLKLLQDILPIAEGFQRHLSGQKEALQADYVFQAAKQAGASDPDDAEDSAESAQEDQPKSVSVSTLAKAEPAEVASILLTLLKQKRSAEIGRKQTLLGPHRDDITFSLNNAQASAFASQGQQRSLVLSFKLAELTLLSQALDEPPVLLLDDVLAELDLVRQGLLMSAVKQDLQTIITTTHLSKFEPEWLAGAKVFQVNQGQIANFVEMKDGAPAGSLRG
jgi:DNA replication and repair protein RecF